MADMYNSACTSSSSSPTEPDDFSLFLHQILLRSSQSSSQPNPPHYPPPHIPNSIPSSLHTISETQIPGSSSSFGNLLSAPGAGYFQSTGPHLSSSSAGGAIDPEEYDSEEGFEALAEGLPATKSAPSRGSSKRTRAAEVHNMSEKRRRSRINEKMKALQNLIPNSNKSDKASMLDEAIEYLKQLQLQVQMLTMKNGLSLYPMFHPGILQSGQLERTKMDLYQENLALNKNIPENGLLNMSDPCTKQFQPSGVPCPIQGHGVPFHHLLQEPLKDDGNLAPPKLPGNPQEAKPLGSVNAVETSIVGTERSETFFPSHVECDAIFGPHLNNLCSDRKPPMQLLAVICGGDGGGGRAVIMALWSSSEDPPGALESERTIICDIHGVIMQRLGEKRRQLNQKIADAHAVHGLHPPAAFPFRCPVVLDCTIQIPIPVVGVSVSVAVTVSAAPVSAVGGRVPPVVVAGTGRRRHRQRRVRQPGASVVDQRKLRGAERRRGTRRC